MEQQQPQQYEELDGQQREGFAREHIARTKAYFPPVSNNVKSFKSPKHTLLVVIKAGIAKSLLLWWQIIFLGWHAGVFIAIGGALTVVVDGDLSCATISGYATTQEDSGAIELHMHIPGGVKRLIAGSIFPVGIIMVVLSGAELFTGNVMYLSAAKFARQIKWLDLVRSCVLSYFANLAGALFVAYFFVHKADLLKGRSEDGGIEGCATSQEYLYGIAYSKTRDHMFWQYLLKAVGCNFLVCISLWCASSSEDIISKIICVWWPIMCFVALGFEHAVANMFFVPLAIMEGAPSITANIFIERNLVPVTIGNVIGGIMFIAVQYVIYHPYFEHAITEGHRTGKGLHHSILSVRQGKDGHEESGSGREHPFPTMQLQGVQHRVPGHENSTLFKAVGAWVANCSAACIGASSVAKDDQSRRREREVIEATAEVDHILAQVDSSEEGTGAGGGGGLRANNSSRNNGVNSSAVELTNSC